MATKDDVLFDHPQPYEDLVRFLTEDPSKANEDDRYSLMAFDMWKSSYYLCQNYVLNSLTNSLVYSMKKSPKEL